jgi:hypothetical protein
MTNTNIDAVSSTANLAEHSHSHTLSVDTSTSHNHTVDIDAFSGSSGDGGFANDDYFQPFVSVNFIIKHDY